MNFNLNKVILIYNQTRVQLCVVPNTPARMKTMLLALSFIGNITPLLYPPKLDYISLSIE